MTTTTVLIELIIVVVALSGVVRIRPKFRLPSCLPHCFENLLLVCPSHYSHLLHAHVHVYIIYPCRYNSQPLIMHVRNQLMSYNNLALFEKTKCSYIYGRQIKTYRQVFEELFLSFSRSLHNPCALSSLQSETKQGDKTVRS